MLHNRKELSGQRRCHPSQVLGLRRERGSLFGLMDRVVAEFIWVQLLMPFILSVLSQGSIGNNLSTSYEVVVWSAYTLPSPDPTMLEYTGYIL
ncbi:hypothetical protein P3L10_007920 [Capsicum annuum]